MDQDSRWLNFDNYLDRIDLIEENSYNKYIFGPCTITTNKVLTKDNSSLDKWNYEIAEYVITSGAVYNLNIFNIIGLLKENYFIDAIDEEICFRAHKFNIYSIVINGTYLVQTFGEPIVKKWLNRKIVYNKYSEFRIYYIIRNHILLLREYNLNMKNSFLIFYNYVIRPIVRIMLFEKRKLSYIKRINQALIDGFFGNLY